MPGFRSWLTLTCCVTLASLLNLSVPQFLIYKIDMTLALIPHLLGDKRGLITSWWQYKIMARAGALTPAS